jgi:plastocyanin
MSRASALRISMAILIVAAGAVLVPPWSGADVAGVAVQDSSFTPRRVNIATHDAVIFGRSRDSQLAHSITSDTDAFPEQEFGGRQVIGFRFEAPGTYAYHCKYHGQAGGGGMSGVIFVSDPGEPPPSSSTSTSSTTTTTKPPTTTTTKPPTTTTTKPPTTTTTKPPTTTTEPPPTTTTEPPPTTTAPPPSTTTTTAPTAIAPLPPVPPPPGPGTTLPPEPPTTSPEKKRGGGNLPTAGTDANGVAAAVLGDDPSTTTSIPPQDQAEAVDTPVDPAPTPALEPVPTSPPEPAVQTLDDLSLGQLTAQDEQPPRRDRTGFVVGAGLALGVFLLVAVAWAWYHRSSRYLPA